MLREEVSKTSIISVFFAMLLKNMYENNAFYHRNDGGSGDRKNGNRDKSGKSAQVCTGYRNITGAPQAYAI